MLAMSKYFSRFGRNVTVISTKKTEGDGEFTEAFPEGVRVLELSPLGTLSESGNRQHPRQASVEGSRSGFRRLKDFVMRLFGQLPDPRLPFALSFFRPKLEAAVADAIARADVVVATTPPWPPLLAAIAAKRRFNKPIVLDYRDQFSRCHEMPGSKLAKRIEESVDGYLARQADALVSISPPMADYYSRFNDRSEVIFNGFDHESLEAAAKRAAWKPRRSGDPVIIRYMGLVSLGRIPYNLLAAMSDLVRSGMIKSKSIKFEYYGDVGVMRRYIEDNYAELSSFFEFVPQVSYDRSLELIVSADYLLFCENAIPPLLGEGLSSQGILTTKLFEYLASSRPIVAHISEKTLAGSFIVKSSSEHFVSESEADFKTFLMSDKFWNPAVVDVSSFAHSLSRAKQAEQYLKLLDEVVVKP